ncbi:glycosyl hydrolase [Blastococcus sp. URHD0036]|uniref:glycosyl hydrolase n=1 Tax=Blastococcus sp. URHD0036 TaxID=1380356 RepID=UPI0004964944|nr:glycosyl hydrolase [Blastococcus sp. URHD0036]
MTAAPPDPSRPQLTPETFAEPPVGVRPLYRWWLPLAYTEDDVLREQLQQLADAGAGGVEVSPFVVAGAGHQSNDFLAEHGWGTPLWAHRMEVVIEAAAALGLSVDQNLGPQYPPTVPTLCSFNQPEAEQQLLNGCESAAPGSTRSGPLPAVDPPSVTTALRAPAAAGDRTLAVDDLGGFAAGDTVTVGEGATAEQVTVTGLGDRTAVPGVLSVSPLVKSHDTGEPVVDVARTTRVRTLVAQYAEPSPADGGPVVLDPASVRDVTDLVVDGGLTHTFPAGNGNPWVLLDLVRTASGLVAQRNGFTATQPNYVVDHWSEAGVGIQTDFWDEHVLTDAVRAGLRRIGRGAVFEDSLELGESQKWPADLLEQFTARRGYDPTPYLPALLGTGIHATAEPAFELPGIGPRVREDYRQTLSELYVERYVVPMQAWAQSHGLQFRAQVYGPPLASGVAAAAAGIPEGESLDFGSPNPFGAEQDHRVLSAGAHLGGRPIVSAELAANFFGAYRSTVAGPNVPGGWAEGGDGSSLGGKYAQGLLDSVHKAFAGGVNQVVWHGFPYRDAPEAEEGSNGRGGAWPGYHPWDIFGVLNAGEYFGPRQPGWPDVRAVNDSLARKQLVLRQGRAVLDLGVYYEDLGLAGQAVSDQQEPRHMLGTDSATSAAGYTYEYVAPAFLDGVTVEPDGGLFADRSGHAALVLNEQRTMDCAHADRLLDLARQGLRLFVVGEPPSRGTGHDAADPDDSRLRTTVAALLDEPTVIRVATEAELPGALAAVGISPRVAPSEPTPALGLVRREADGVVYDVVYNRSADVYAGELSLTGDGVPHLLDTWTGRISPIGRYARDGGRVTLPVRIAPYDTVVIALAPGAAGLSPAPRVHAVAADAEVLVDDAGRLLLRAPADGEHRARLSDGTERTVRTEGLAPPRHLTDWTLRAQSWTAGDEQWTSRKTDHEPFPVAADDDGRLPSWLETTAPVDLSRASGVGTYTTTVELPASWGDDDGAWLDLGDAVDTVQVTVNGTAVVVDQSDRGRIDLGRLLVPGTNTLTVRVATTMFNAVRAGGNPNYATPDWQRTGLMGPVVLAPYRDIPIAL